MEYNKNIVSFTLVLFLLTFIFTSKVEALSSITTSLDIGSSGADVTTLQTFLSQDDSIYPQKLITGYFGNLTASAVKNFQMKYGIPVVGKVGPLTKTKINELITSGNFGFSNKNQAPIITAPTTTLAPEFFSNTMNSSVIVSWQTDKNSKAKIYYSTSPLIIIENTSQTTEPTVIGANVVEDNSYSTVKTIRINNLWPTNTSDKYYYMVQSTDLEGNISVSWPRVFSSTGLSS